MRTISNQPSKIHWEGHVLESPIDIKYVWMMMILAIGMMMNGCLCYFFVDGMIIEMMMVQENQIWKLDHYSVRQEYLLAFVMILSSLLLPGLGDLSLHAIVLTGLYYLDFKIVRPFLLSLDEIKKE